jgi:hypothetical protein
MTMRAIVERDIQAHKDAYRGKLPPDWLPRPTLPCFVWSDRREEVVDASRTVVMQHARGMFPVKQDLTEKDRVVEVRDRIGRVLFAGPFDIRGLERKEGWIEAGLRLATS